MYEEHEKLGKKAVFFIMTDDTKEMIDEESIDTSSNEESFAEMFEAYDNKMKDRVHVGDRIKGEIISIGRDAVFVDTGTRMDGVVEKSELENEEGEIPCQVGDEVELYAVAVRGGEIRLSKAVSGNR